MNRVSDRLSMSPDFAWYIGNGYVKKDIKTGLGIIVQRNGITKFNSVTFTNACKYIYEPKWNAGGTDIIIREGTRWAKWDGVDSFDDLDTGRSDGVRGQCVMFANELIMVDGAIPRKCTAGYVVSNLSTTNKGTFTVTIASPAVFSLTAHGFIAGTAVYFSTTGALPTGLTAGTTYYVISAGLTANAFEVSATVGGSAKNTSGSQSGTHTIYSYDPSMPTDSTAAHVHQHKVWFTSIANPMKAYYCKTDSANAADSWSAAGDAGSLDFSKILPFGDKLLGFATFSEMFLVFIFTKQVVVYTCGTDPSAFAIQQIIPLNCISGHGVQQVGNDLAVVSQEGMNSFRSSLTNQDLDIDDLSKYIAPLYRELITNLTDRTVVSLGFSHRLNHIYVCIPTIDHTILVYSVDIKNFVGVWMGYKCYSICELVDGTMLIGGDGYIYTMNYGTNDDGVKINFQYDFPFLYAGNPNTNKAFRQLEGLCRYTSNPLLNFIYSYAVDVVSGVMPSIQMELTQEAGTYWDEGLWDESDWDISGIERLFTSDMLGRGKQISLSILNSVLDTYLEIPYIILRYKEEGIKVR